MYHAICVATGDTVTPVIKAKYPSAIILKEDNINCVFIDDKDFTKFEIMMKKAEMYNNIKAEQQKMIKS